MNLGYKVVSNLKDRSVSRRSFPKRVGAGLAAVGTGALLPGCAPKTATPDTVEGGQALRMWWWGEQEAAGLENWVKESIELCKEQLDNAIEALLQDTAYVVSGFQAASAARNVPDIQYFWDGIYHMESVWLGYAEPLDGLIPDDILKGSNATVLSVYQGKQYRIG